MTEQNFPTVRSYANSISLGRVDLPDWIPAELHWMSNSDAWFERPMRSASSHLVQAIEEPARAFHERAGTLTKQVVSLMTSCQNRPVVRAAHQPNTVAYGRLFALLQKLATVSKNTEMTAVFYFIDYDTVGNNRFHSIYLPDPRIERGYRRVSLGGEYKSQRTGITAFLDAPPRSWIDRLIMLMLDLLDTYDHIAPSRIDKRLTAAALTSLLEECYCRPGNLAECNAAFISKVANNLMALPIAFVPGSALWGRVPAESVFSILEAWPYIVKNTRDVVEDLCAEGVDRLDLLKYTASPDVLPIWMACRCGSRVAIRHIDGMLFTEGCVHCGAVENLRAKSFADLFARYNERLFPRILLQTALNVDGFGYNLGLSHGGSAGHVLVNTLALQRSNIAVLEQRMNYDWYLGNHALSVPGKSQVRYDGLVSAQAMADSGQASILYYLISGALREKLVEYYG